MGDHHLRRAEDLLHLGRYAQARDVLLGVLAENPGSLWARAGLAQCYLGLENYPEALAQGNAVVGLAPNDEWGHRLCALALDRMDRHAEATGAAANAVRLDPQNWRTHQIYAQAAIDTRDLGSQARAAADRTVQLAPNEPDAHFTLGLVAHRTSHYDVARAAYERTLALDPNHAMAMHNLTVLQGGVRLSRSARGFSAALQMAPQESVLLGNVDGLAVSFIRRVYFAALVALVLGLVAIFLSTGDEDPQRITRWSVGVGILVLAGVAAYAVSLARSLPDGIRIYLRSRIFRDAFLIANLALSTVMLAVAMVVCFAPGAALWGLIALQPLGLANVALFVWAVLRR